MPLIFVAIAAALLQLPPGLSIRCYSCASPELASQWQTTGLPVLPQNVRFEDQCENKQSGMNKVDCASSCMEMLVVAGTDLAVVRGCWHDFFGPYGVPNIQNRCSYGDYYHNVTVPNANNSGVTTLHQVLIGAIYCSTDDCNQKISSPIEDWVNSNTWINNCAGMTTDSRTSECVNCHRYDWSGDCYWDYRQTCTGQWCTKTTGYVNGKWLEKRGCAPINPAGNQICYRTDSAFEHTFLDNHPLSMPFSLETCFCEGSKCNGTLPSGVGGSAALLVALAAIFALLSASGRLC